MWERKGGQRATPGCGVHGHRETLLRYSTRARPSIGHPHVPKHAAMPWVRGCWREASGPVAPALVSVPKCSDPDWSWRWWQAQRRQGQDPFPAANAGSVP